MASVNCGPSCDGHGHSHGNVEKDKAGTEIDIYKAAQSGYVN